MTIYYPDVSSFQSGISLKGAVAAAIKATQGTGYTNPDFSRAVANANANGCYPFAYHFLTSIDAAGQASYCYSRVGSMPLMLDVEATTNSNPGMNSVVAFLDAYKKLGGVCYAIYLPHWYWNQIGSPSLMPLIDRKAFLVSSAYSAYTDSSTGAGWLPYGGMTPQVWQYTDRFPFNGRSCDFNAFRGTYPGKEDPASVAATLAEFRSLLATGRMTPPPPPPPTTGPYPNVADGSRTLDEIAAHRGTTAEDIELVTRTSSISPADLTVFNAYVGRRPTSYLMPHGTVYYTRNR